MTTKVQGSIAAAVRNNPSFEGVPSSRASESPGSARRIPDGFDRRPPPDIDRLLGGGRPALPLGDRFTASDLHKTLSNPLNSHILSAERKSETITRDQSGIFRGPNGQPLVPVRLDDGNTAYVDPNTNRYYLTDEQPGKGGSVRALPAIDLPQDSQFSNRYFNDQDARDLTQIASDHSPWPWLRPETKPQPMPHPLPFPWPDRPQPLPMPSWPDRPRLDLPLRDRNIAV